MDEDLLSNAFIVFFFGEGWVETDSGSTSLCQNLDVFGLLLRGRLLRVYNWKHTCSDAKFVTIILFGAAIFV